MGDTDRFCLRCGCSQTGGQWQPPRSRPGSDPLGGLTPRAAAVLCYIPILGWIAAIIVLAAEKFRANRFVRFHAFQGLYLFVAWLLVEHVIGPMFRAMPDSVPRVDKFLDAAILVLWIFMMVKASHEQTYSLPIIGELAERSASER